MNPKREMSDARMLARSKWVRAGLLLQLLACLTAGFFAADIRWNDGRIFVTLLVAGGADGPGAAFNAVRYSGLVLALAGGLCLLVGWIQARKNE